MHIFNVQFGHYMEILCPEMVIYIRQQFPSCQMAILCGASLHLPQGYKRAQPAPNRAPSASERNPGQPASANERNRAQSSANERKSATTPRPSAKSATERKRAQTAPNRAHKPPQTAPTRAQSAIERKPRPPAAPQQTKTCPLWTDATDIFRFWNTKWPVLKRRFFSRCLLQSLKYRSTRF